MASALVLRSAQEYQRWLLTYVKHLTQGGSPVPCHVCLAWQPPCTLHHVCAGRDPHRHTHASKAMLSLIAT